MQDFELIFSNNLNLLNPIKEMQKKKQFQFECFGFCHLKCNIICKFMQEPCGLAQILYM